jgi:type VI secretion system protein ImpF
MPAAPRRPSARQGAPVLLFDRLTDAAPRILREPEPLRVYDVQALRDSVAREVERLLNTRRPVAFGTEPAAEGTVLTYGIGDHAMESAGSDRGRQMISNDMRRAIERYEPRLRKVRIEILNLDKNSATLTVRIDGELRAGSVQEQVYFPVSVRLDGDRRDL